MARPEARRDASSGRPRAKTFTARTRDSCYRRRPLPYL